MCNRMFEKGRQNFASGDLDWDAHKFVLMPLKLDGTLTDTAVKAITGVTVASPGVVTSASHGFSNGDLLLIRGVLGTLNANGLFKAAGVTTNTFQLQTLDGQNVTTVGTYVSGGCVVNLTAPTFFSDIDGAVCAGAWAFSAATALGSKTNVNGLVGAANVSNISLNDTCHALALIRDVSDTPASSPLVHIADGRTLVRVVADAANGATTLWVDALEGPLASGTVIQMSNGVTVTLSGAAVAGARSLPVNALSGSIAAGHHGDAQTTGSGLPISISSGVFTHQFDSTNGIFQL